jgi:predicted HNH restriction endonuclease
LERDNLATFNDGRYFIESAGRALIKQFRGVDKSFNNQGFGEPEISLVLKPETPRAFVEEGQLANVSRKVRKRSRKLRAYAIDYFADNEGTIRCIGCDFEASEKYGDEFNGFIEIHHKQPVALSRVRKVDLAEAVQNLAPLCPTSHRVVHSSSEALLSIEDLQLLVRQ